MVVVGVVVVAGVVVVVVGVVVVVVLDWTRHQVSAQGPIVESWRDGAFSWKNTTNT